MEKKNIDILPHCPPCLKQRPFHASAARPAFATPVSLTMSSVKSLNVQKALSDLLTCLQLLESHGLLARHDVHSMGAPDEQRGRMGKGCYCFPLTSFHSWREAICLGMIIWISWFPEKIYLNCVWSSDEDSRLHNSKERKIERQLEIEHLVGRTPAHYWKRTAKMKY